MRRNILKKKMNSLKKGGRFPLLNFTGGTGVPLLYFEGGPGVPLLNSREVPGSWSHFFTMPFFKCSVWPIYGQRLTISSYIWNQKVCNNFKQSSIIIKAIFTDKAKFSEQTMLVESEKILIKNVKTAENLNNFFLNAVKTLRIWGCEENKPFAENYRIRYRKEFSNTVKTKASLLSIMSPMDKCSNFHDLLLMMQSPYNLIT